MKFKLLLCFTLLSCIFIFYACEKSSSLDEVLKKIPDPKTLNETFVSDPDKILQQSTIDILNSKLQNLDISRKAHIDVTIVRTIEQHIPKDAAYKLFNDWKIGDKEKNNGLLILLVLDQRRVEFETGYGIEDIVTDIICYRIQQDYMISHLKKENYDDAILSAVDELIKIFEGKSYDFNKAIDIVKSPEIEDNNILNNIIESDNETIYLETESNDINQYNHTYNNNEEGSNPIKTVLIFIIAPVVLILISTKLKGIPKGILLVITFFISPFLIYVYIGIYYTKKYLKIYKSEERDRYIKYLDMDKNLRTLKILIFIYPIPIIVLYRKYLIRMKVLRDTPYCCQKCSKEMIKLNEQEDDEELKQGQHIEEKLKSVDYDIWICNDCNTVLELKYPNPSTKIIECGKCKYMTSKYRKKIVVTNATENRTGWGWKIYICQNCKSETKIKYIIPMISDSSSSGGGSGSSSFSSSSGGSSGGGGAGSSW